jgi:hypothetical protein
MTAVISLNSLYDTCYTTFNGFDPISRCQYNAKHAEAEIFDSFSISKVCALYLLLIGGNKFAERFFVDTT